MTLDDILSASELRYVMDDLKQYPPTFIESSVPVSQLDLYESSQLVPDDDPDYVPPGVKRPRTVKRNLESPYNYNELQNDGFPCLQPHPGFLNFELHLPADDATHKWTVCRTRLAY